jgi:hypothetical protein
VDGTGVAEPVVERLMALLEQRLSDEPERLHRARRVCARVDTLLQSQTAEPSIAKPAALLAGAVLRSGDSGRDAGVPIGEPALLESDLLSELLCVAGIANDEAKKIEQTIRSVFSARQQGNAEVELVRAAMHQVTESQ